MTASSAEASHLPYATTLPWRRRRSAKRLIATAIVVVIAVTGFYWFPPARDRLLLLHWQERCLRHSDLGTAMRFYSRGNGSGSQTLGRVPQEWQNLYASVSPPGLNSEGTVFLHRLRSPVGATRLVAVDAVIESSAQGTDLIVFTARVLARGSPFARPRLVHSSQQMPTLLEGEGVARTYPGIVDAADESHFTFVLEWNGRRETVDGWLRNDDTVVIELRPKPPITPLPPASPASLRTSGGSGRRGWPFRVSRSSGPPASTPASSR